MTDNDEQVLVRKSASDVLNGIQKDAPDWHPPYVGMSRTTTWEVLYPIHNPRGDEHGRHHEWMPFDEFASYKEAKAAAKEHFGHARHIIIETYRKVVLDNHKAGEAIHTHKNASGEV